MLEIFQNLEQMMERFAPLAVIVSGVVFLLLGLCMWLGGLALRKGFIAIAGLLGGCILGLFVVGRNLFSASLTGALAMLSTLILEKLLVILLAAALTASIAFTVAAEPYFEQAEVTEQVQNETSEQTTITEPKDFILELKTFGLDSGRKMKQAAIKIPIHIWPIITTPALIVLICSVFLWRFTSALFFSVLGTMAAFFGVFLMLIYQGTEPVDYVRNRPIIFAVVFAVTAAFGMIIQLLICKKSKKQKITKIKPGKTKTNKNNVPEKIVEHDWRSA